MRAASFLEVRALSPVRLAVAAAVLVAALAVTVLVLTHLGSSHGAVVGPGALQPAGAGLPPPPPRGALVLAREAGTRAVALAVERGPQPRLTATVLASSGDGLSGLPLSFRLDSSTAVTSSPCGQGCYEADLSRGPRPRFVEVLLPGDAVPFRLPAATRPGAAIVARSARTIRRLRSLVYFESLRSGPTGGLRTTWRIGAPDRLTYEIQNGASAVVIGRRRWDQARPGAPWVRSQQVPPLQLPQPAWGNLAVDARVLGEGRVDGRPVWVVSFVNPGPPAWFTVWIDRRSYLPLRLRMTAAAHFMYHRYESFDKPLRFSPPA